MGVYIYSLRSPKLVAKVKLDNGNVVTVGRYAYEYKPLYSMWDKEPRWQILAKARINKLETIWRNFIQSGGQKPDGGVIVSDRDKGYKIEIGSTVYAWNHGAPVSIEDCTMSGASSIGKVAEIL